MIVTLLTDFGDSDAYVAAMKGVILRINPAARLIDIAHNLRPHRLKDAAWLLNCSWRFYPAGTVHLVVVDPGVGGERRPIIITRGEQMFVGPDNGVFTYLYDADFCAYEITNSRYMREEVSKTFHGRDIFAPVAAHLSAGVEVGRIGTRMKDPVMFEVPRPMVTANGVEGSIMHVDHFGNLITNINRELFERAFVSNSYEVVIGEERIPKISASYDQVPEGSLLAIWGSENTLEISANLSSAARRLNIDERSIDGVRVLIRKEGK